MRNVLYSKLGAVMLMALAVSIGFAVDPVATASALPGIFGEHGLSLAVGAPAAAFVVGDVLDVFGGDPFKVRALTDAINKIVFVPGRAGIVADWRESGVTATSIMIEEKGGLLQLVDPTPRGGPGLSFAKNKRKARILSIPHYQIDDAIYADEVQGVRAWGEESQVQMLQTQLNDRFADHTGLRLDPTLEFQRMGTLKGQILNADLSVLYNLFDEFEVEQQDEQAFPLDNASDTGAIRTKCDAVVRLIARSLGGASYSSIHAFCSDEFWDALVASKEVRATYLQQQEASQLREGTAFGVLNFGGITWENYRGGIGEEEVTPFIEAGKAHIFPLGVPGLFRTVNAPADYIETVNTPGLPRYVKQFRMPNDKGIALEIQANSLSYCTRPRVLIQAAIGEDE